MMNLVSELNSFSEATTIHGLAYLSKGQAFCTRLIWSMILLMSAAVAGFFLYETISGFNEKYTSTTIESRSVNDFPFPAVTFHPGDYICEDAFPRVFLNQFEFTRFQKNDTMRDNDLFLKKFDWLVSPMSRDIYTGVKNYLLEEREFIRQKGKIFKDEVCSLLSLKLRKMDIDDVIGKIFGQNSYKFRGFSEVIKFIKKNIKQEIYSLQNQFNVSKSGITTTCKDPKVCILYFDTMRKVTKTKYFSMRKIKKM